MQRNLKCGDVLSSALKLRPIVFDDRENLFDWRNDYLTRKNSLNEEMVKWEKHCQWFERTLASQDLFFMLEDDGVPVGQVRIDVEDGVGTISYSIAPNKRGLGYGKKILQLCENYLYKRNANFSLRGIVKKNNVASQKIFLSLHYMEQENNDYFIYEKKVLSYYEIQKNIISGGVILLTNNRNSLPLYEWISKNIDCLLFSEKITVNMLENYKPRLVVSYNYTHIIKQDIIDYMKGQCVNLHISMLPWNKGADPNFWSFIDNTPKGVTIHRVAKGLDTGDIIFQREIVFDESKESFSSTYHVLQKEITDLFEINFHDLLYGNYKVKVQDKLGTYHCRFDMLKLINNEAFDWSMNIKLFKENLRVRNNEFSG